MEIRAATQCITGPIVWHAAHTGPNKLPTHLHAVAAEGLHYAPATYIPILHPSSSPQIQQPPSEQHRSLPKQHLAGRPRLIDVGS